MAKLPIRYEIESTSAVDAEMRMICSTVISEGGYEPIGDIFASGTTSATTIDNASTYIPIISIRLKESDPTNRATIILKHLDVINNGTGSNNLQWRVFLLADDTKLTNESFSNVHDDSIAQIDEAASAVNVFGAHIIASGLIERRASESFEFAGYMSSPIINSSMAGKSRIFCLAAVKTSGNIDVHATLNWLEIR